MRKQENTLQDLVNRFMDDHYIFRIDTQSRLPHPSGNRIEYQLREVGDQYWEDYTYECHISTTDENEFYKLVVDYILKSISPLNFNN